MADRGPAGVAGGPAGVAGGDLRRFRVLVGGTAASSFGSYLNMVALNLFVYQATGSAVATGLFLVLRMATGFVAGLVGGAVAARLPRRPVMIACDLVQAGVLVVFALSPDDARVSLLPVVAVSIGALSTTSQLLLRASVPDLVGPEHRLRANGLLVTGRAVAMALGFATGGVLVTWVGYTSAFLVNAGTFGLSALVLASVALRFPGRAATRPEAGPGPAKRRGLVLAALAAAPAVAAVVAIRSVDAFGSASHQVGIPIYATQLHPADPAAFVGNFWAAWAVGLFAAHRLVSRFHRGGRRHDEWAFVIGTAVMSGAFIAAFSGIGQPWVLLVALVAGLADGFTEITYTTRVQAEPDPARGWFFGLTAMAENAGLGLGLLVASGLLEVWTPWGVAALMHGLVVVLAAGYLALTVRRAADPPHPTDPPHPAGPPPPADPPRATALPHSTDLPHLTDPPRPAN
ncbi:MFS transporter [Saccharothrix sp. BKS2]|uniref:MFS transporter n=1 Tax=Saccharothrix sp. BKS2 TaxID=3064400 RepID=UPI0039ED0C79